MNHVCTPQYKHALLFIKPCDETSEMADKVASALGKYSIESHVVAPEKTEIPDTLDAETIGIVLGGDGTFLSAARRIYGRDFPLVGINFGNLGFMTEIDWPTFEEQMNELLCWNKSYVRERPYLMASLERNGKEILVPAPLLNEAALHRGAGERMIHFTVTVGGKPVTSSRADGIIVATPTGSTAYNLSTGGPILHPALAALVVAPICPHTLSFRPVVVPWREVKLKLENDRPAQLALDGQTAAKLEKGDVVVLRPTDETLKILHVQGRNFFQLLREKLGWDLKLGS